MDIWIFRDMARCDEKTTYCLAGTDTQAHALTFYPFNAIVIFYIRNSYLFPSQIRETAVVDQINSVLESARACETIFQFVLVFFSSPLQRGKEKWSGILNGCHLATMEKKLSVIS